jgi:hypothetical protein
VIKFGFTIIVLIIAWFMFKSLIQDELGVTLSLNPKESFVRSVMEINRFLEPTH